MSTMTPDHIEQRIHLHHPRSHEPMTLVVFELGDVPGGTLLTVVESGFDRIPLARRAKAFRDNEEGWAGQMAAIVEHLRRRS